MCINISTFFVLFYLVEKEEAMRVKTSAIFFCFI